MYNITAALLFGESHIIDEYHGPAPWKGKYDNNSNIKAKMNNLFYFPNEGAICWIAGYRSSATQLRDIDRQEFCNITGADPGIVAHYIVRESPRYKGNHVFRQRQRPCQCNDNRIVHDA
mgnify:FL=1